MRYHDHRGNRRLKYLGMARSVCLCIQGLDERGSWYFLQIVNMLSMSLSMPGREAGTLFRAWRDSCRYDSMLWHIAHGIRR